jgi:cytochrome P450
LIKFAEEVTLSLILLLFRGHDATHTFSTDSLFLGYLPGVT